MSAYEVSQLKHVREIVALDFYLTVSYNYCYRDNNNNLLGGGQIIAWEAVK